MNTGVKCLCVHYNERFQSEGAVCGAMGVLWIVARARYASGCKEEPRSSIFLCQSYH